MSLEGVRPAAVILTARTAEGVSGVRPGQTLSGTVHTEGGGLFLRVGNVRVPIPGATVLAPGQAVTVEVIEGSEGLQLRVLAQDQAGAAANQGARTDAVTTLVARVLEAFGDLPVPEAGANLVPDNLPVTEQAVRALISLFVSRGSTGEDVRQIAGMLSQAANEGIVSDQVAAGVAGWLSQVLQAGAGDSAALLRQARRNALNALEARLARLLASGETKGIEDILRADMRAQLSRLLEHESLSSWLRGKGQLRAFQEAVGRVIDRLSANHVQNLRGLEHPYLFIELPYCDDAPIRHGQIHFFSDGRAGRRGFDPENFATVLDLATTTLGDLWIALQVRHGYCTCRIRATTPAIVATIRQAASELAQDLESIGYRAATVQVALWDGDRLRAAAGLMRRFSGIDMRA